MYGWDTKSWRNSTENRQQKQACAEATKAYTASQPQPDSIPVRVQCACPAREYRHDPMEVHGEEFPRQVTRTP
ncbi:MAG: hypothetical protein WBZ01_06935 [Terriglobales bacterium]|jgi:hypothetical protein